MKHKTTPEMSVTSDVIRKVHLMLSDIKTGEEVLSFLKSTEPVFMDEVNRFINTEISRLKFQLSESQAMYIGSIIGATYISGFLISREATNKMFNSLLPIDTTIRTSLSPAEIEKMIDKGQDEGKSYKEIAKLIRRALDRMKTKEKPKNTKKQKKDDKRFDIGDLS